MRKFEYKYKIDEDNKTIVALSTFAGKPVAGVARCMEEDEFNVADGKELAAARCSVKVAEKRMKRAEMQLAIALDWAEYWTNRAEKMRKYDLDAANAYREALRNLADIEENLCE